MAILTLLRPKTLLPSLHRFSSLLRPPLPILPAHHRYFSSNADDKLSTTAEPSISQKEITRFNQFVDNNPKIVGYFKNACEAYVYYKTDSSLFQDGKDFYMFGSRMVEEGFPLSFDQIIRLLKGKPTLSLEKGIVEMKREMKKGFSSIESRISDLRSDVGDVGQKVADKSSCVFRRKPDPVHNFGSSAKNRKKNGNGNGNGLDDDDMPEIPGSDIWM